VYSAFEMSESEPAKSTVKRLAEFLPFVDPVAVYDALPRDE